MWCLLLLTSLSDYVTDLELVSATGDLERLLSASPSASGARDRLRDHVLLHNVLGAALHTPLYPGGTVPQPNAVLDEVRALNATRVLELGYGKGFNALHLAQRAPGVRIVAVDDGPSRVADASVRAVRRNLTNVEFRSLRLSDLACPEPFDVVYSIESLRYTDPAWLLSLAGRCLRRGGALVLIDAFVADGFAESSGECRTALRLVQSGYGTRMMPSVSHWRRASSSHGFRVSRSWDWTSEALPFWDAGAYAARKAMYVYSWLPESARASTVASVMAPRALRGGATMYGGVLMHREL